MISRNLVHARSALVAVAAMMFFSIAAQAATSLSIAIAGEPWKDPSISSVGTKLSLATPPSTQSFGLGWSSSVSGAMGVNWQVKKAGAVVASGTAALTKAIQPNTTVWIFIPSSFIAAKPPAAPVDYFITVTAFDGNHKPIGAPSAPVVVSQAAETGNPTGPIFGRNTIFPSVTFDRYAEDFSGVPGTQLEWRRAKVKITIANNGPNPTDKVLLYIKDFNVLMRQDKPIVIDSIAPGAPVKVITLTLSAVLPPALSQLPEDRQFTDWYRDYHARGVDLRVVMDFGGPKNNAPLNDHAEVKLYEGSTDSCADGKKDGDETPVADCGGSCDCCFGKNVETSWWRDVYGFNFSNDKAFLSLSGKYDLGDVQGVFGTCSIYIGCPLVYIPDPFAAGYLLVVKAAIDGNGRCFGFSLAALSFLHRDESLSNYPMGGPGCDTWHLASPVEQNSPALAEMIKRKHMYQMTNEVWQTFIEMRANSADREYWHRQLASSLPAILSLCDHAVIAIGITPTNDGFTINLADPNNPFSVKDKANELTQASFHAQQLGLNSIKVSGGHYTFNDNHGVSCEGTAADDLTPISYARIQNPSMPSDPSSLIALASVAGSAVVNQVSDAAGNKLFLADGSINHPLAPQMRAYPFHPIDGRNPGPVRMIIADAGRPLTHTVAPSGAYQAVFLGPNYMVHIDQASGGPTETDDITVDPRSAAFGLTTRAASKALRAELTVRAPDKSVRQASAQLKLSANKRIDLQFDEQRETVSYHHTGPASELTLTLWSSQKPELKVTGRAIALEEGDVVNVKPNWAAIDQAAPTIVNVTKSGGVTRQLQFH
jgi:hypothetical protein